MNRPSASCSSCGTPQPLSYSIPKFASEMRSLFAAPMPSHFAAWSQSGTTPRLSARDDRTCRPGSPCQTSPSRFPDPRAKPVIGWDALELEERPAGLEADAADGVRQAERRADVEALGVVRLLRRVGHHLLEQADRQRPRVDPHVLPDDRPEPVAVHEATLE